VAGTRILVVEDEQDIIELIAFNLEREGFQVVKVRSGEEALAAVKTDPPDLIVLDVMLPGMNGLDVCRALRRTRATSRHSSEYEEHAFSVPPPMHPIASTLVVTSTAPHGEVPSI